MIEVSHIRQFVFCPRIFYFYNFCNIKPVYPEYVNFGTQFHKKQNMLFKSRKFAKFKIDFKKVYQNLYLYDEKFCGICDLVLVCEDEVVVAEFKDQTSLSLSKGAKMQLIAYANLASKHFSKPSKRVILCGGNNLKFKIYNITKNDIYIYEEVLKNIDKLLENEFFPNSSASKAACEQCEFINYCNDRE